MGEANDRGCLCICAGSPELSMLPNPHELDHFNLVDALRPIHHFVCHVERSSTAEPVHSNHDKTSKLLKDTTPLGR